MCLDLVGWIKCYWKELNLVPRSFNPEQARLWPPSLHSNFQTKLAALFIARTVCTGVALTPHSPHPQHTHTPYQGNRRSTGGLSTECFDKVRQYGHIAFFLLAARHFLKTLDGIHSIILYQMLSIPTAVQAHTSDSLFFWAKMEGEDGGGGGSGGGGREVREHISKVSQLDFIVVSTAELRRSKY